MKSAALVVLVLALGVAAAWFYQVQQLRHPWVVTIQDLHKRSIASLRVRFTEQPAPSCLGGTWKRVVVERFEPAGEPGFPGADPLSYRLDGLTLTIGRNEICDAYVGLSGRLHNGHLSGEYYSLGEGGKSPLGYVDAKAE